MKLLLFLALFQESRPDPIADQWISFVSSANSFIETYMGCPKGIREVNPASCRPALGTFDDHKWQEARKRAAELFKLEIPKPSRRKK